MAAAMVMAKAIKMRIAFPSFLLSPSAKRELIGPVASNTKQTGAVATQSQPHLGNLSYDAFIILSGLWHYGTDKEFGCFC
jgi:hypothetical protein